ncbi:MAG TPA: sugar phosphate nucleotidyltransferase [Phycisphaerae bacterium]|nr:sugar phosphate nucleotidyltransferase [Phycisphaerae bacterium]HOJ74423.1 sugar phosphate nucleotidyltransferase [Phycisphaerae bacterium]HOM52912.1 sugar phosphate nucleotidyltransferase [Phycisphaerae bacterium]HON66016.1 sugar phosphate nucleotidyltransferase [Phycisphaerae bacterium]HOQ85741.1 sugar phosphate nucleotidyltransferase [Phycisphaerae bacterium]
MKVVLFCGGQGTRLRDYSEAIPKPMVNIGYRPVLWHLMKYYAHFGHKEFILCLGYKADAIKNYFLHYDECVSNDFTLSGGGRKIDLMSTDIDDWSITCVDTGPTANIGQRLKAVQKYIKDDEVFLANYADSLTDLHLPDLIADFEARRPIAMFLSVRPRQSFHVVTFDADQRHVRGIVDIGKTDIWINGGYFVFDRRIFDYIREGEELVNEPFARLIAEQQLMTHKYTGFWACLDTLKDKQQLDDLYLQGEAAWEVWKNGQATHGSVEGTSIAPASRETRDVQMSGIAD